MEKYKALNVSQARKDTFGWENSAKLELLQVAGNIGVNDKMDRNLMYKWEVKMLKFRIIPQLILS